MSEHKWYMMAGGSMSDTTARLAGLLHSVPGVECDHIDGKQPTCERDAAVLAEAGVGFWTSDFDAMREYAEAERERANKAEANAREYKAAWKRTWRLANQRAKGIFQLQGEKGELRERAEKAEAALAQEKSTLAGLRRVHSETVQRYNDLRERVRAMADGDECELLGQYASRDLHREVCPACSWARRLRALLDDRSAS